VKKRYRDQPGPCFAEEKVITDCEFAHLFSCYFKTFFRRREGPTNETLDSLLIIFKDT
jgi:hypothetical protein